MSHSVHSKPEFKNSVVRWIDRRLPIFTTLHGEYIVYPMPKNVNYFWSFGAMATVVLVVMLLSGIILAMQYVANTELAFDAVERIMRDVNYGWLLRYIHMNGASMFFIAVYIHIFRGLYYGSYKNPRELIWLLGVIIFVLMMATAFMGYVLPWGQMSYWGATVITNLFSAFPIIGEPIVTWLWGGFSIDNPTLNRFFALHYLLPFVLFVVVMLHVAAMHQSGSNNPAGIEIKSQEDSITFHPYVSVKDSLGLMVFLFVFAFFVFIAPNYMGHSDNYIPANPLSTPAHIVPEWYFLPFYAILRAIDFQFFWFIPAKLGGVLLMFGSLIVLALLPWLDTSKVRSCRYRPIYCWCVLLFVVDVVILGYVGGKPAEGAYVVISKLATLYYFAHFLIITPLVGWIEQPRKLPNSIAESVLKSA